MARDELKRDCSTCVYGDNGTNPEGCPETCLEPELSDYEPTPEEPCRRCVKCGGELDIKATIIGCRSCGAIWGRVNGHWVEDTSNAPPKNSTARDETRDVWIDVEKIQGLGFRIGDSIGVPAEGHARYVPHDQLEAAERDRDTAREAMEEFAKRAASLDLHIRNLAARIDGDGGQRQDGETIEQTVERVDAAIARLQGHPPRCKDGCKHWRGEHWRGEHCASASGMPACKDDGSDFCANHTALKRQSLPPLDIVEDRTMDQRVADGDAQGPPMKANDPHAGLIRIIEENFPGVVPDWAKFIHDQSPQSLVENFERLIRCSPRHEFYALNSTVGRYRCGQCGGEVSGDFAAGYEAGERHGADAIAAALA